MARVNVFFGDELLEEINREADREKTNRSSLIQTAVEEYLEAKRRTREESEKRKQMAEACRKMDNLAKKLGNWGSPALARKHRDGKLKEKP